jgi:hypothetical protein
MRHATAVGLVPLILLSALPVHAQMITLSPEQIGQIFCIAGLGNDMAPVEGLLSDDLKTVVDMAWEQNTAFELANPGDKPPLGDGLPWRTYPDYADGCTVGEGVMERESATIAINYTFSDYPDANYSNELTLLPAHFIDGEPPIWRIDDIDLGEGLTFRQAIAGAFEAQ